MWFTRAGHCLLILDISPDAEYQYEIKNVFLPSFLIESKRDPVLALPLLSRSTTYYAASCTLLISASISPRSRCLFPDAKL